MTTGDGEMVKLNGAGNSYAILQLRNTEETSMKRFASLRTLERMGLEVRIEDYETVYVAPLPTFGDRPAFLEAVFEKFNLDHPESFNGHSLSVSDIVAICENGVVSCYFCDNIGWREFPGLAQENYQKK